MHTFRTKKDHLELNITFHENKIKHNQINEYLGCYVTKTSKLIYCANKTNIVWYPLLNY